MIVHVGAHIDGLQILGTGFNFDSFQLGTHGNTDNLLGNDVVEVKARLKGFAVLSELQHHSAFRLVNLCTPQKGEGCG